MSVWFFRLVICVCAQGHFQEGEYTTFGPIMLCIIQFIGRNLYFFFLSFFRCFAHLKLNQFTDSIYHGIRNRGPHRITGLRRRSWHANYCYLHNLLSFLLIVSHFEASCISMYMVTEYHLSCVWLRKRFIFFAGAFNSLTGKNSILFFADFRHPKFHSGLLFHHI